MKNLLVVTVALLATQATAERVAVLPFTGARAAASQKQLDAAICGSAECVAPNRVANGARPDWKKIRRELVTVVVTGAVGKKGKIPFLDLTVTDGAQGNPEKLHLLLNADFTLNTRSLGAAVSAVKKRLPAPAEPTPVKETPVRETPVRETTKPPDRTPPPRETPVEREKPPPPPEEPAKPRRTTKQSFLGLEVGADLFNRRLDYVQPVSPTLRRYELTFVAMPTVKADFYPLALTGDDGLLSGLGLEVGLAGAPWLRSRRPNTTDTFPTSLWRFDGGVRLRIQPVKSFSFRFWPALGVRVQSFTVGTDSTGARIDGLPNISYTGLRIGLGFELKVMDDLLAFFGRFDAEPVFSAGEIISSTFFQGGSTFGLDAQVGAGFQVLPMLQLRASFELTRYSLSFKTQPTDAYVAQGALDQYLGVNVAARFSF